MENVMNIKEKEITVMYLVNRSHEMSPGSHFGLAHQYRVLAETLLKEITNCTKTEKKAKTTVLRSSEVKIIDF